MSESKRRRTRRVRRKENAGLAHPGAKPTHKSPSGRTGKIKSRSTPQKSKVEYHSFWIMRDGKFDKE